MKIVSRACQCQEEIVCLAPNFLHEGDSFRAIGFYEITASKNSVFIHNCILNESMELFEFNAAMASALMIHNRLKEAVGSDKLFPATPTEFTGEVLCAAHR